MTKEAILAAARFAGIDGDVMLDEHGAFLTLPECKGLTLAQLTAFGKALGTDQIGLSANSLPDDSWELDVEVSW